MSYQRARALATGLAKFSVVGGTGVIVNQAALLLFYGFGHLPVLLAGALSAELAVVNNFLLNDRWTFGRSDLSVSRFLRFNLVSIGGVAIASTVLYILVGYGLNAYLANFVGIGLATVWNFALNAIWTWRWQL